MFDLTDQVALVTGAGNPDGLGIAIARCLASAGAKVAVTATTDRIFDRIQDFPDAQSVFAARADLAQSSEANELVRQVVTCSPKLYQS